MANRGFVTRRSFRGGTRQVRSTVWGAILPTRTSFSGASVTVLFSGFSAAALALRPFTIVRVRGLWHVSSDQEVADEVQHVALGFAVVSDQAIAAGVASVPTPFAEADSDLWFLYELQMTEFLLGSAVGFSGDFGVTREFESKAMRKVDDGQDLAIVMETASTSNGMFVSKAGRFLLKLH